MEGSYDAKILYIFVKGLREFAKLLRLTPKSVVIWYISFGFRLLLNFLFECIVDSAATLNFWLK